MSPTDAITDLSSLTEDNLRHLLSIIQMTHPGAVESAIVVLRSGIQRDLSPKLSDKRKKFSKNDHSEGRRESQTSTISDLDMGDDKKGLIKQLSLDGHEEIPPKATLSASVKSPKSSKDIESGCYLLYDADSCKLILQYSKKKVSGAIGFYTPGRDHTIQEFKFKRNSGRVDLIGNCASGVAGRKNYYSGWCQFIRAAKAVEGKLWIYPRKEGRQGLDVDIYVYVDSNHVNTFLLPERKACNVRGIEAVACLPKNAIFFTDVKVDLNRWMTEGSTVGSTTRFNDTAAVSDPVTDLIFSRSNDQPLTPQKEREESHVVVTPKRAPPKGNPVTPITPTASGEARKGCYLLYDANSCKLMLHFSKVVVPEAIGFYSPGPGHKLPEFKFKRNSGRTELIGNCASGIAGRKNYYSGWCQFVRAAKAVTGTLWIYPRQEGQQGLDVDIYVYRTYPDDSMQQTVRLEENEAHNVTDIDAVACLPKSAEFFESLKVDLNRWLTDASNIGAASRFEM